MGPVVACDLGCLLTNLCEAGVLIRFQPEQIVQLSLWELNEHLCHSVCSFVSGENLF